MPIDMTCRPETSPSLVRVWGWRRCPQCGASRISGMHTRTGHRKVPGPVSFNARTTRRSIHPRLPHDSPNPTATHPFRPQIESCGWCGWGQGIQSECDAKCDSAGVRIRQHRAARNARTRGHHSGERGFLGNHASYRNWPSQLKWAAQDSNL